MEIIRECAWHEKGKNKADDDILVTHFICDDCKIKYFSKIFPEISTAPNVKDTTDSTQEIGQLHNVGSG